MLPCDVCLQTGKQAENVLSELCVRQQLLHHGSLPLLLGNTGMIEVHSAVHHGRHLHPTQHMTEHTVSDHIQLGGLTVHTAATFLLCHMK